MLTAGQEHATGYAFTPLPRDVIARQMQAISQIGP